MSLSPSHFARPYLFHSESLRSSVQPGCRVFRSLPQKIPRRGRRRLADQPPANTKLREIAKVLEFTPALTPKLIELAQWISAYYLAPIGEVFRSMLPPLIELNVRREIILTSEGRAAAESLGGGELSQAWLALESALLKKPPPKSPRPFSAAAKLGDHPAALQKLRQRGLIRSAGKSAGHQAQIANDRRLEGPRRKRGKFVQ